MVRSQKPQITIQRWKLPCGEVTSVKLPWFSMSGVGPSFVHHVSAVVFAVPTVSATNQLVLSLDEFLGLQIDTPRVDGTHQFSASVSYRSAEYHVGWCLRVKATKFKILGNMSYLN